MRYHVLKASVTIRNIGVCVALVAASYLASALVNASPITRPPLVGPRSRGVIVSPRAVPTENEMGDAPADAAPNLDLIDPTEPIRRL